EVRNWLEVYGEPVPEPTRPMATGALGRVTTPPGAPPGRWADLEEAVRHALTEDRRVNEHLLGVVDELRDRLYSRRVAGRDSPRRVQAGRRPRTASRWRRRGVPRWARTRSCWFHSWGFSFPVVTAFRLLG